MFKRKKTESGEPAPFHPRPTASAPDAPPLPALGKAVALGFVAVGINDVLEMWIGNSERNLHALFEARPHLLEKNIAGRVSSSVV